MDQLCGIDQQLHCIFLPPWQLCPKSRLLSVFIDEATHFLTCLCICLSVSVTIAPPHNPPNSAFPRRHAPLLFPPALTPLPPLLPPLAVSHSLLSIWSLQSNRRAPSPLSCGHRPPRPPPAPAPMGAAYRVSTPPLACLSALPTTASYWSMKAVKLSPAYRVLKRQNNSLLSYRFLGPKTHSFQT